MATQVTTTTGASAAATETPGLDNLTSLRPDAKKKVEAVIRNMKSQYDEQLAAASSKIDDLSKQLRERRTEKRKSDERLRFVEAQLAAAIAENNSLKGLQAALAPPSKTETTNPKDVEGHTVITMKATLDRAEPLKAKWALLQRDFVELNNAVTPIYNDSPGDVCAGKRTNEQLLTALGVAIDKKEKDTSYTFTKGGLVNKFNALKERYLTLVFDFNKVMEDLTDIEDCGKRSPVPPYHQETVSRVEIKPLSDFQAKFEDHESHYQQCCAMLRELTTMRTATHEVIIACRKHMNFIWKHTTDAPRDPNRVVDLEPTELVEKPKENETGGAAGASA